MSRQSREVAVGVPHHITHCGNNRLIVFRSDADRSRSGTSTRLKTIEQLWPDRILGQHEFDEMHRLPVDVGWPEKFTGGLRSEL